MAMREVYIGAALLEGGVPIIVDDLELAKDIAMYLASKKGFRLSITEPGHLSFEMGFGFYIVDARFLNEPGRLMPAPEGVSVKHVRAWHEFMPSRAPYGGVLVIANVDKMPYEDQPKLIQLLEHGEMKAIGYRLPENIYVILHARDLRFVHPVLLDKVVYVGSRKPLSEVVARGL